MMQVTHNSNETLGVLVMKTRGFFPQAYWYWIGVGALIGYVFLFNFLFTLALQYLNREYRLSYLFLRCWTLLGTFSDHWICCICSIQKGSSRAIWGGTAWERCFNSCRIYSVTDSKENFWCVLEIMLLDSLFSCLKFDIQAITYFLTVMTKQKQK